MKLHPFIYEVKKQWLDTGYTHVKFMATLNVQEKERKRIAENLHNGLGQLLYGVKLSLEHLNSIVQSIQPDSRDQRKVCLHKLFEKTEGYPMN